MLPCSASSGRASRGSLPWAPTAALLFVGALLAGPEGAAAQASPGLSGGAEVVFQNFSFADEEDVGFRSVSLLTTPFAARLGLGQGFRIELRGAFARGELVRLDDSSVEISGPTDTEVRMVAEVADGAMAFTAFASLPTGDGAFSGEELALAGVVGADLLPFRISNWGAGGGMGGAVTLVHTAGEYGVGVTAGYTVQREFEPLSGENLQYRPGDQLHVRGAVDRTFGTAGKGTLQVSYQRYGDDAVDGENLFRSGDRLQATGSYAFAAGSRSSAIVYAGYQHRSQGTFLLELDTRSSQGLALAGAGLRTPFLGGVLAPSTELRVLRRSDGIDQGVLGGVGATLEIPAGGITFLPSVRGRMGTVTISEGVESGVQGFEVGFGARF